MALTRMDAPFWGYVYERASAGLGHGPGHADLASDRMDLGVTRRWLGRFLFAVICAFDAAAVVFMFLSVQVDRVRERVLR